MPFLYRLVGNGSTPISFSDIKTCSCSIEHRQQVPSRSVGVYCLHCSFHLSNVPRCFMTYGWLWEHCASHVNAMPVNEHRLSGSQWIFNFLYTLTTRTCKLSPVRPLSVSFSLADKWWVNRDLSAVYKSAPKLKAHFFQWTVVPRLSSSECLNYMTQWFTSIFGNGSKTVLDDDFP